MENELNSEPLCLICKEPLQANELGWHAKCAVCQICGGSMQSANKVIQKCLDDGGPVAHMGLLPQTDHPGLEESQSTNFS